jgi:hypothetical protein
MLIGKTILLAQSTSPLYLTFKTGYSLSVTQLEASPKKMENNGRAFHVF